MGGSVMFYTSLYSTIVYYYIPPPPLLKKLLKLNPPPNHPPRPEDGPTLPIPTIFNENLKILTTKLVATIK
jgi:hypothetical protein